MNFFDNINQKTSRAVFGLLDAQLNLIAAFHWGWFALVGVAFTVLLLVGRRLRRFNHPDRPLLSPVIRSVGGTCANWTGALGMLCLLLLAFEVLFLTAIGATAQAGLRNIDQWSMTQHYLELVWPWVKAPVWGTVFGATFGLIVSAYLILWTIPLGERGAGLRDVRHMQKLFVRMRQFSPLNFIDLKKGIFVGLEDARHPVYLPFRQVHETHLQVLGASGGGKGISLGVLGYQFIMAGECTIAFDPKGDRRLPTIFATAAKRAGVEFHYIDLNPAALPQFNLIAGTQPYEIEELLVGGLGLEPSSGEGNYYRGKDQDAAQRVAFRAVEGHRLSLPDLLNIAESDEAFHEADNFVRRLRQVCDLPPIQTNHDIDLAGIVGRGGVIYVRGSTDNHRVKTLQTMLLIRLLQIVKSQITGQRRVALILDEFKHLLCRVSLDALGTVRELGCHAVLAHQSMGDLGGVPGLRREDVEPRVVDNTTLKMVFRIGDQRASEAFAAKSGKQRTHAEGVRGINDEGHDQRTWSETQEFRMSDDLFTHLHRPSDGTEVVAAGVLFGYGAARLLAVSPISVSGNAPVVVPAPPQANSKPQPPEAMI